MEVQRSVKYGHMSRICGCGGGGMSAGQTGQTDQHSSTGLGKNVIIIDTMSLLTGMSVL